MTCDNMKFSVVIPVYNVAPYLRECLDSVLMQTCTDWECICVDDGSTDGSAEILDEFRQKSGRFRVVCQKNAGVSAARNRGLGLAKGEWVWFVDGDDRIHPDTLRVVAGGVADNPSVDIVKYEYVSGETMSEPWKDTEGVEPRLVRANDAELALLGLHGTNQYLMRRSVLDDLRFEPFRWLEDVIFVVRYLTRCRDLLMLPVPLYFYRTREGSAMHSRRNAEQVAEIFRALNLLVDAAGELVGRNPGGDHRAYWKHLHIIAYFEFGSPYFELSAHERGALLDEWLRLQTRFVGLYPVPLEWRLRLALVRLTHSGRLVRPIVLWGARLRGTVSRILSRLRGGRK